MIEPCFSKQNWEQRYQYVVIGRDFVKSHSKSNNEYKQNEIVQLLDFLIYKIFLLFDGRVFQQTFGILMGTNCAQLLVDLLLHVYGSDFLQGLLKNKDKKLAHTFNAKFRYIEDVLLWIILDSVIICNSSIQISLK